MDAKLDRILATAIIENEIALIDQIISFIMGYEISTDIMTLLDLN